MEILVYFPKMWCQLPMAPQNFRRYSLRDECALFLRDALKWHTLIIINSFWVVSWKTNEDNSVCITCTWMWSQVEISENLYKKSLWYIIYLICLFSKGFLKLMNLLRILIHLHVNVTTIIFVNNLMQEKQFIHNATLPTVWRYCKGN